MIAYEYSIKTSQHNVEIQPNSQSSLSEFITSTTCMMTKNKKHDVLSTCAAGQRLWIPWQTSYCTYCSICGPSHSSAVQNQARQLRRNLQDYYDMLFKIWKKHICWIRSTRSAYFQPAGWSFNMTYEDTTALYNSAACLPRSLCFWWVSLLGKWYCWVR